jgi:hypothetical protein
MEISVMKALLATAALVVVASTASPATAQVYGDRWDAWSLGAYAQAPLAVQRRSFTYAPSPDGRVHSPNPAYDVYDTSGRYISSDPDPFIRNELARDPPGRDDD